MITIKFGLQADMRSKFLTSPALNTLLGDITAIQANARTEVTAGTSKGGTMVLTGKFKFSSENSLRDSDVTGVAFFDKSKHLLMSVANVADVSFSDIGRQEKVQTIATFMLQDVALGVTVEGSAFGDVLLGYAGADKLSGNAGNDILRGGAGNDVLNGGLGNDQLDGGLGKDVMGGGAGNDSYTIDHAADTVVEAASGGIDSARASVTWVMGANLESLDLTGKSAISATGNAIANVITGNVAANTLRGLAGDDRLNGGFGDDRLEGGLGNDRLDGGRGTDRMVGGPGSDTYTVDNVHDVVVELASQGSDTIRSSVSYTLPANVERLVLTGSGDINATGNGLDNLLSGNSGANTLNPGHGHDVVSGGGGADTFVVVGGAGDTLRIDDLLSGVDHLSITHSAVSALAAGALASNELRASTDDPNGAHLVYNASNGELSYDAAGDGLSLTLLTTLASHPTLLASDITILPA